MNSPNLLEYCARYYARYWNIEDTDTNQWFPYGTSLEPIFIFHSIWSIVENFMQDINFRYVDVQRKARIML